MSKAFKDEESAKLAGENLLKTLKHKGFSVRVWENYKWYFTLIKQIGEGGYHDKDRIEIYVNKDSFWIDSRINDNQYYCDAADINEGVGELREMVRVDIEERKESYERLFL